MGIENKTELTPYQRLRAEHGLDPFGEQLEGFHYVMWEDEKEDGRRYYLNIGTETIQFTYSDCKSGIEIQHFWNYPPEYIVCISKEKKERLNLCGPRPECYSS